MTSTPTLSEFQLINVNYYITLTSFTLLVYEYLLTFSREVDRFWSSKRPTWPVVFFFVNRYFTLFGHVPIMVETFWYSTAVNKLTICRGLQTYSQYFVFVVQVLVSALMIMRVYALFERSRKVLFLVLAVTAGVIIVACWCLFSGNGIDETKNYVIIVGCSAPVSRATALGFGGAWGGMLVFDTLIFGMTVYKSLVLRQLRGPNLLTVMLRDGSIYFGVMMVVNTTNILTFVYGGVFTRGILTTFMNATSSVMITRLMLNLRDPRLTAASWTSGRTGTTLRTPQNLSTLDPENEIEFTEDHGCFEHDTLERDIELTHIPSTLHDPHHYPSCLRDE